MRSMLYVLGILLQTAESRQPPTELETLVRDAQSAVEAGTDSAHRTLWIGRLRSDGPRAVNGENAGDVGLSGGRTQKRGEFSQRLTSRAG